MSAVINTTPQQTVVPPTFTPAVAAQAEIVRLRAELAALRGEK